MNRHCPSMKNLHLNKKQPTIYPQKFFFIEQIFNFAMQ